MYVIGIDVPPLIDKSGVGDEPRLSRTTLSLTLPENLKACRFLSLAKHSPRLQAACDKNPFFFYKDTRPHHMENVIR